VIGDFQFVFDWLLDFFLNHVSKPYDILFSSFFDPKKKKEDW
jgi:hypothetical protein